VTLPFRVMPATAEFVTEALRLYARTQVLKRPEVDPGESLIGPAPVERCRLAAGL
jgi:hypothetical protein